MPRRKPGRPKPAPRKGRPLRCERLEERAMLAGDLELVRDIRPGNTFNSPNNDPRWLVEAHGLLYFTANDGVHGAELWRSDGTQQGTRMVADLSPGFIGAEPSSLINVGGTLYFASSETPSVNAGIWRVDGPEAGVIPVRTFSRSLTLPSLSALTNVSGTLYFRLDEEVGGAELWKSDGSEAGTMRVKDIWLGSNDANPQELTNVGGTLYFTATDGLSGRELWKSDGTESGTVRVKDILPGVSTGFATSGPRHLTDVGGTLYFAADDGVTGYELWKTDGTANGTVRVKDISPGVGGYGPADLTNTGGTLYFTANDGVSGDELWKSDGTEIGTVRVRDILVGSGSSLPQYLLPVGEALYFLANDGANGIELWKSDGNPEGTVRVTDIRAGASSAFFTSQDPLLTYAGGKLYFKTAVSVRELWRSDGTEGGTVPVRLPGDLPLQNPTAITSIDDRLFVVGVRPDVGTELFTQVLIDPPALAGDFDRNGVVDQADREVWLADYGSTTRLQADGNGDGVIDAADYTVWRDNLGASLPADVVAVDAALAVASEPVGASPRWEATGGWSIDGAAHRGLAPTAQIDRDGQRVRGAVFVAPRRGDLLLVSAVRAAAVDAVLEGLGAEGPGAEGDGDTALGRAVRPRFVAAIRR